MLMIKAKVGNEVGGIIAQDAETIRFVKPNGKLVSVTHLKERRHSTSTFKTCYRKTFWNGSIR